MGKILQKEILAQEAQEAINPREKILRKEILAQEAQETINPMGKIPRKEIPAQKTREVMKKKVDDPETVLIHILFLWREILEKL